MELQSNDPLEKYIENTLLSALNYQASDIHIEPCCNNYRVRLRSQGLLIEQAQPPRHIQERIIPKLKIMAKLDIAEQRRPQDGSLNFVTQNKQISMRLSTCPTIHGEKLVLRLLNKKRLRSLNELNLNEKQKSLLIQVLSQPQGLILVCGPTGSGKTTTLYAALQYLNTIEKNIITIEDPVEIPLDGINQVNVNRKIALDFNTALRTFLRQDPDIIMVGEIRDSTTAEIAIKAAQTGHLVLSTLHSNSATKSINRLRNMGIANYDLADALKLIISQRLIRIKKSQTEITRHAVYEFLHCNDALGNKISNNETNFKYDIDMSLADSALLLVKENLTTLTEVKRVIDDEELRLEK